MRLPDHTHKGEVTFNMTPMIDVVFLLIIFFLVSSHLAKQEAQMPLPLPTAESGERRRDQSQSRLTVNVLADGRVVVAGRRVLRDRLVDRFRQKVEQSGPDVEVVIRTDQSVPYGQLSPIMLACTRAGIWNVTIGVFRPEDVR